MHLSLGTLRLVLGCPSHEAFSSEGRTMKMSSGFSGASCYVLSCSDMNGEKNVFITQNGNLEVHRLLDPITFPLEEGARNPNEAQ